MNIHHTQRGAALIVGLLFLLMLTLLTVSWSSSTLLQERMVGNVRESNTAFQSAEDVVRQVEKRLKRAAEQGTTEGLNIERWTDSGLATFDCAGRTVIEVGDPASADWSNAPESVEGATGRFRLIQMSNVSGRAVACKPLEEEARVGAGSRSSYYLIFGYAEGQAGTGESMLTSTYYYEP